MGKPGRETCRREQVRPESECLLVARHGFPDGVDPFGVEEPGKGSSRGDLPREGGGIGRRREGLRDQQPFGDRVSGDQTEEHGIGIDAAVLETPGPVGVDLGVELIRIERPVARGPGGEAGGPSDFGWSLRIASQTFDLQAGGIVHGQQALMMPKSDEEKSRPDLRGILGTPPAIQQTFPGAVGQSAPRDAGRGMNVAIGVSGSAQKEIDDRGVTRRSTVFQEPGGGDRPSIEGRRSIRKHRAGTPQKSIAIQHREHPAGVGIVPPGSLSQFGFAVRSESRTGEDPGGKQGTGIRVGRQFTGGDGPGQRDGGTGREIVARRRTQQGESEQSTVPVRRARAFVDHRLHEERMIPGRKSFQTRLHDAIAGSTSRVPESGVPEGRRHAAHEFPTGFEVLGLLGSIQGAKTCDQRFRITESGGGDHQGRIRGPSESIELDGRLREDLGSIPVSMKAFQHHPAIDCRSLRRPRPGPDTGVRIDDAVENGAVSHRSALDADQDEGGGDACDQHGGERHGPAHELEAFLRVEDFFEVPAFFFFLVAGFRSRVFPAEAFLVVAVFFVPVLDLVRVVEDVFPR